MPYSWVFLFEPCVTLLSMYLYNFTKLMGKEKLEAQQPTYKALVIQILKIYLIYLRKIFKNHIYDSIISSWSRVKSTSLWTHLSCSQRDDLSTFLNLDLVHEYTLPQREKSQFTDSSQLDPLLSNSGIQAIAI